jgi:hypothetical protein
MVADHWAGNAGAESQVARALRDSADDRPYEWTLSLAVDPGMKVIRDEREGEACRLRGSRVTNKIAWRVFFA